MRNMTLVKADYMIIVTPGSLAKVIDLGLAIDEMARILAVHFSIQEAGDETVGAEYQAALSWDPEDTSLTIDQDRFFVTLAGSSAHVGTAYGGNTMISQWFDFTNLMMATTRNLALLFSTSTVCVVKLWSHVYYEKFKPTQMELVQYIAQRR